MVTTRCILFLPSLVPESDNSIPRDANITVRVRVSDPYCSKPISRYGIIAAATQLRREFYKLAILSTLI